MAPTVDGGAARRAAFAAALLTLAAGAPTVNRLLVGVFYDDGLYAGLATALARGLGYVHPHLPGTPAAVHYPPLYPLVLAPLFGLLPLEAAALAGKVLNLLLGAAAAGLVTFHVVRRRLLGDRAPPWLAAAVVVACATAVPVLTVQAVLFAEPLFALLFAATLIAADRAPDAGRPTRAALLAGALAALTLLTRSIGIVAAGAIALWLGAGRPERWVALAASTPPFVAAVAWSAWVAAHRSAIDPALALSYGCYAEAFAQAGLSALAVNVPDLVRPLAALTIGWLPGATLVAVVGAAAIAVGAYGAALLARRSSAGFALPGYVAILAIWPYPPDRFLWAVLPWLGLAWAAGAVALWRHRATRAAVAALSIVVAAGYAQYQARGLAGRWWRAASQPIADTFADLLPAVRELPGAAIVATDDEALVWLYTGRGAVPFYLFSYRGRETVVPDAAAHRAYLERQGVTHVLLATPSGESAVRLRVLIEAYPGWLVPLRRFSGARWLFVVTRGGDDG